MESKTRPTIGDAPLNITITVQQNRNGEECEKIETASLVYITPYAQMAMFDAIDWLYGEPQTELETMDEIIVMFCKAIKNTKSLQGFMKEKETKAVDSENAKATE